MIDVHSPPATGRRYSPRLSDAEPSIIDHSIGDAISVITDEILGRP
jgi:hypothetical protein